MLDQLLTLSLTKCHGRILLCHTLHPTMTLHSRIFRCDMHHVYIQDCTPGFHRIHLASCHYRSTFHFCKDHYCYSYMHIRVQSSLQLPLPILLDTHIPFPHFLKFHQHIHHGLSSRLDNLITNSRYLKILVDTHRPLPHIRHEQNTVEMQSCIQ